MRNAADGSSGYLLADGGHTIHALRNSLVTPASMKSTGDLIEAALSYGIEIRVHATGFKGLHQVSLLEILTPRNRTWHRSL